MNRWLFFLKTCLGPRQVQTKCLILNEHQKTKIRQHLAFQYGIYAVERGIYPFVTPESCSDMCAWAEAYVTPKTLREGSQVPACCRHLLLNVVSRTHMWEGRSMRSNSWDGWSWYWLDTEWYCLHLITPWPMLESVSLCGWAFWVISRHAQRTERRKEEKKKEDETSK